MTADALAPCIAKVNSNHEIDVFNADVRFFLGGPTTCNILASWSDVKSKYIFMFSWKKSVWQGFNSLASGRYDDKFEI